jgi:hypothetical protein
MGTPDVAREHFRAGAATFDKHAAPVIIPRRPAQPDVEAVQPNVNRPDLKRILLWRSWVNSGRPTIGDIALPHGEIGSNVNGQSPFTDPRLEQTYDYWRDKAARRAMPSRADIDPTEIPKLLPDVMLVERMADGRYRYRLIGTENQTAHGINATGRFLDEVLPGPAYAAHVLSLYDECVETRRPLYSECLFFAPARLEPERHTKVLFMPLSADGDTVNMIFVIQVFFYIDRATRERHFVEARPYKEITHILL